METEIYEIPNSIAQMFDEFAKGETSYRIINTNKNMSMDNNQSMAHFLECSGIPEENVIANEGTQVVIEHQDYNFKIVIDAGGLGDFYSHGFEMSRYEDGQ